MCFRRRQDHRRPDFDHAAPARPAPAAVRRQPARRAAASPGGEGTEGRWWCWRVRWGRGVDVRAAQPAGGSVSAGRPSCGPLRRLQRGTSDRIRNRRANERTGDEAGPDDIVKGRESGGEHVPVGPKELDDIAPGRRRTLEIGAVVALDDIGPIFCDTSTPRARRAPSAAPCTRCRRRPGPRPTGRVWRRS
ncbi:Ku protein [Streptomyces sp. NPDC058701]|uniref:Ku protein n=1 Tax=Streptomyces sp. NPDC058701 TaxID=3346608 RepID=UPI0036537976